MRMASALALAILLLSADVGAKRRELKLPQLVDRLNSLCNGSPAESCKCLSRTGFTIHPGVRIVDGGRRRPGEDRPRFQKDKVFFCEVEDCHCGGTSFQDRVDPYDFPEDD